MTVFDDKDHQITSVESFMKINHSQFYETTEDPGKWMFRGHSKWNYTLVPSVGRLLGNDIFQTKEQLFSHEESAFNEFKISAYSELKVSNDFIVMAVAQHHGLKTRLLDWTFSASAALFFAVEEERLWDCDGALMVFQAQFPFNSYAQQNRSPFDLQDDYEFLFVPSISPRIRAQQGVFQLFPDPTEAFEEGYNLGKYLIPAASKKRIKKELNVLGVSYKTLFPDLDGLCKSVNYEKLKDRP